MVTWCDFNGFGILCIIKITLFIATVQYASFFLSYDFGCQSRFSVLLLRCTQKVNVDITDNKISLLLSCLRIFHKYYIIFVLLESSNHFPISIMILFLSPY